MHAARRRNPHTRNLREEAREVVRIASKSRKFPGAASVVRGATNNAYEALAEDLLTRTARRAAEGGIPPKLHREAIAEMVLQMAAEAAMRVLKVEEKGRPKSSGRKIATSATRTTNPKVFKLSWSKTRGGILTEPRHVARTSKGTLFEIERVVYPNKATSYRIYLVPASTSWAGGVREPVATRDTLIEAKRQAQQIANRMEPS